MSMVRGFAEEAAGAVGRVGDAGREAAVDVLLAMEFVDAAFCSVGAVPKGFGAAYFDNSFVTLVWLGFF